MKWFLILIVVLNMLVGLYGYLKQTPASQIGAQDINASQLKLLAPDWRPDLSVNTAASAPAAAAPASASAPHSLQPASAPLALAKPQDAAKAAEAKLAADKAVAAVVASATQGKDKLAAATPADKTVAKPADKPAVVPADKPASKTADAGQCLQWGNLDPAQLERVQGGLPLLKLLKQPIASVTEEQRGSGKAWVYYPPLATQAETLTLVAELKGKGFDSYIVKNDGPFKGQLSLGLFGREAAARDLVKRLQAAGYDKAKVDVRGETSKITSLRFTELDAERADKLRALQKRLLPGRPVKAC